MQGKKKKKKKKPKRKWEEDVIQTRKQTNQTERQSAPQLKDATRSDERADPDAVRRTITVKEKMTTTIECEFYHDDEDDDI